MACYDVTFLQNGIHSMVADNCNVYWNSLDRNYGGYRKVLEDAAAAEEAQRRIYEARTSKTAVLLSEAYQEKQKRIKRDHEERRRKGVKKVQWEDDY